MVISIEKFLTEFIDIVAYCFTCRLTHRHGNRGGNTDNVMVTYASHNDG